jgi:hypothetical protein
MSKAERVGAHARVGRARLGEAAEAEVADAERVVEHVALRRVGVARGERGELFGRHQNVNEVGHVRRVVERDVLFERRVEVARVLGRDGEQAARALGQIARRELFDERFERAARGVEVAEALLGRALDP